MNTDNLQNIFDTYHLSTEGYYFKYRKDNNNPELLRATLYRDKTNEQVNDICVSEHYGFPAKTHHQVINHFEVIASKI